ncbi:ASST-domain-containing protein [Neohortaea acidophila]|uniref:ASST-domain-containing protein n=1 Tax=Neohortaea acidophila TaxID=245834 RepID=A0A6A6Q8E5_9PEZI|nr:ASST-domain-containing protein [Neohortaea acidophila]KAF2487647.1 ASST-domain-containing protein [Neohortaea acidophila]
MRSSRLCCSSRSPTFARWQRIGTFALLGLIGIILSLTFIHRGILPILAWLLPGARNFFYDLVVYGSYPTAQYVSFAPRSPDGIFARRDERCDDGMVFIGPYDKSVENPGPVIQDSNGELVWMSEDFGQVTNFRVQRYQGEDYLTFWHGEKHGSSGQGSVVMLDSTYTVAHELHAVGHGLKADLHEFQLTEDGTAILSIVNDTTADLRAMGWGHPQDGWITDCIFQEVDIATGRLVFQWRASDHFKAEDSYYWHPFGGYVKEMPFDFYHINSVEKDPDGNFLLSSRHFHHVLYINGSSGEIIWILGGHRSTNQFTDLSDGKATGFQWQHHARWLSFEDKILSLLDNGIAGPLHVDAPYSKGLILQLDTNKFTAEVLHEYISLGKARAASQGSLQRLPNGNMLIGWGATAAWSEHTIDGEVVCEGHFAASWSFWWERVKSYRVFKFHGWMGNPVYPPSARLKDGQLYMSWNGATEVHSWELHGVRRQSEPNTNAFAPNTGEIREPVFEAIQTQEKRHFEQSFDLAPYEREFEHFRVAALDANMQVLRVSELATPVEDSYSDSFAVVTAICASVVILAGILWLLNWWTRQGPESAWVRWAGAKAPSLFGREYRYSKL